MFQFQFPSNGKVFPNVTPHCWWWSPNLSFNSLQTGRCFRTVQSSNYYFFYCIWFQFPSNGKVFPNLMRMAKMKMAKRVSIPFKREGVSEPITIGCGTNNELRFQFPSNGKVFPNNSRRNTLRRKLACFNSLQTGRCFRTEDEKGERWIKVQVSIPFKREGVSER